MALKDVKPEEPVTPLTATPVDHVMPVIYQAAHEWMAKNTPEIIKEKIHTLLDKESQQVTLKLLGFDNSWGDWKLDHCNGRNGNSAAGDYLREKQAEAIKAWLETVELPTIPTKLSAEIKKNLQDAYDYHYRNRIRELVITQADKDAKEAFTEILMAKDTNKYLAAETLLQS